MAILATGGAGYIGSHTCVELLNSGYDVVIIDDLSNSSKKAVDRIEQISGKKVKFYKNNLRDETALDKIFKHNKIDAIIHFAGFKAVGESVEKPVMYYENNIGNTVALLKAASKAGCKKIVFSSSAAVYGVSKEVPVKENTPTGAVNPYGKTKLFIEEILKDVYASDNEWSVMLLRYFNPIGAHESGLIGEDPRDIPNNLMPYITQVAVGKLQKLSIFGDDYNTPDGTGVRDYIHVVDLAKGHVKAIDWAMKTSGVEAVNLGTGRGTSVLELRNAFVKATGVDVPFVITGRRSGDVDELYANCDKAKDLLGWVAEKDIEQMCKDAWNFQKNNPNGYEK